jgi:hypothetical protein
VARMLVNLGKDFVEAVESWIDDSGKLDLPQQVKPEALLKLAQEICRDDLDYFESAEMLVWEVARHEGFVIPDYPLASNSEVKAFLKEYNARDVADWYQKRGVLRSSYDQFWKSSALMARNRTFWRKVIVFPKSDMDDANLLARDLCVAVTFCMGKEDGERDSRLFSI